MSIEVKIVNTSGVPLLWEPDATSLVDAMQKAVKRGVAFPAGDFRGLNLRGADLSFGSFVGAKFEGANLIGVNFTSANLTNADFSGATTTEAVFTSATVTGVDKDALATAADVTTSTATGTAIPTSEKAAASGVASLSAGSLVVQNPANATATPTASKIPMTGAAATSLAEGWRRGTVTAVDTSAALYAVLATDESIEVTTGAASNDVDLLTAVGCAGKEVAIKKVDAGAGTVPIDPAGVEEIENLGAGNALTLTLQGEGVILRSNGTKWAIKSWSTVAAAHGALHLPGAAQETKGGVVDTVAATPFAVLATHRVVLGAATAGFDQVANLPAADAAQVGRPPVRIYKMDANAHNVVVTPAGADTINGVAAAVPASTVTVQYGYVDVECIAVGAWVTGPSRLA